MGDKAEIMIQFPSDTESIQTLSQHGPRMKRASHTASVDVALLFTHPRPSNNLHFNTVTPLRAMENSRNALKRIGLDRKQCLLA